MKSHRPDRERAAIEQMRCSVASQLTGELLTPHGAAETVLTARNGIIEGEKKIITATNIVLMILRHRRPQS
jgi:filamentous hemagglutinin family protein